MSMDNWPFADPKDVAVFVDDQIIKGKSWIAYVGHDADDGAWQFHGPDGFAPEERAAVTGLGTMVKIDSTICELADLPLGWFAWREKPESEWQRGVQD